MEDIYNKLIELGLAAEELDEIQAAEREKDSAIEAMAALKQEAELTLQTLENKLAAQKETTRKLYLRTGEIKKEEPEKVPLLDWEEIQRRIDRI